MARIVAAIVVALAAFAALGSSDRVQATNPGENGLLTVGGNFSGKPTLYHLDPGSEPLAPQSLASERFQPGGQFPSYTADGARMAWGTSSGIFVGTPTATGVTNVDQVLINNQSTVVASMPSISPDGTEIAFADSSGDSGIRLAVVRVSTGAIRYLGGDPGVRVQRAFPTWSPDGSRIAFIESEFTFIIGSEPHEPSAASAMPSSAPSGVFWVRSELRTTPSSSFIPQVLAAAPSGDLLRSPDYRPDGSEIAYVQDPDDSDELGRILSVDTGVGSRRTLVLRSGCSTDTHCPPSQPDAPVWSPDGDNLAFTGVSTGAVYMTTTASHTTGKTYFRVAVLESPFTAAWQPVSPPPDETSTSTSTSSTTTTIPDAELILDPTVGPPGTVVMVRGTKFLPGESVMLVWNPGIGGVVATADADGTFEFPLLILPKDVLGLRLLEVTREAEVEMESLEFLVVTPTVSGGNFPDPALRPRT